MESELSEATLPESHSKYTPLVKLLTNCATCTTECLPDKATKKIPFLWSGTAPALKDVVRVDGILAKTAKGYIFTAERVTKQ